MTMTSRLSASPVELLRDAAGGPRELGEKLLRLLKALRAYGNADELDARLVRLKELGTLDEVPTRLQLIVGANDMLRFWIVPCAEDYYRSKGINFTFHQVLRFLDDPAGLVDPTGFLVERDVIIGHVLQVVHANPAYDFQLLETHEDGLAELERQTLAMLDGTHPRARSIGAVVEEPDYHTRLLAYVREYRASRDAKAPVRTNVHENPKFRELETVFGTLSGAMRYFAKLPKTPSGALRHWLSVREFPWELAKADSPTL